MIKLRFSVEKLHNIKLGFAPNNKKSSTFCVVELWRMVLVLFGCTVYKKWGQNKNYPVPILLYNSSNLQTNIYTTLSKLILQKI